MLRNLIQTALVLAALLCAGAGRAALNLQGPIEVVISVADQRMAVLCEGGLVTRYPVSTSRFGAGDSLGSYRTPLGRLRICDKIGDGLPAGAVIKHRSATGEVLQVNAPGRDPIVTRILWLEGLDEQNRNAKARSIYIHGTPEEKQIGKSVSWGCIRMRSSDVEALYEEAPVGTLVTILAERLPHYPKYVPPPPPPPPELIVSRAPAPAATVKGAAPAAAPAPAIAARSPVPPPQRNAPPPIAAPPHSRPDLVATIKWQGDYQSGPSNQKAAAALKQSILLPGSTPVILTSRNARQPQPDERTRRQPAPAEHEQPKAQSDALFPPEKLSLAAPPEPVPTVGDWMSPEFDAPAPLFAWAAPFSERSGLLFDAVTGMTKPE